MCTAPFRRASSHQHLLNPPLLTSSKSAEDPWTVRKLGLSSSAVKPKASEGLVEASP